MAADLYIRLQAPAAMAAALPRTRDIAELTFGPARAGLAAALPDDRKPVQDTRSYPWRANAALRITVPGQSDMFLATGWFIGPCTVISAAHAVYPYDRITGRKGWVSRIEVSPGQR